MDENQKIIYRSGRNRVVAYLIWTFLWSLVPLERLDRQSGPFLIVAGITLFNLFIMPLVSIWWVSQVRASCAAGWQTSGKFLASGLGGFVLLRLLNYLTRFSDSEVILDELTTIGWTVALFSACAIVFSFHKLRRD